jgi:hypothetical protein
MKAPKEEPRSVDESAASEPQMRAMYSDDGVDLTLIRWMLSLTPTERLRVLQQWVRSIERLRGGAHGA